MDNIQCGSFIMSQRTLGHRFKMKKNDDIICNKAHVCFCFVFYQKSSQKCSYKILFHENSFLNSIFVCINLQNGYPSRRRSLVDDARFESSVVKQTKQNILDEARVKANGELCVFDIICLLASYHE